MIRLNNCLNSYRMGMMTFLNLACILSLEGIKDVPVSGRHGDTAWIGTVRSGIMLTRPGTVWHGAAWPGG